MTTNIVELLEIKSNEPDNPLVLNAILSFFKVTWTSPRFQNKILEFQVIYNKNFVLEIFLKENRNIIKFWNFEEDNIILTYLSFVKSDPSDLKFFYDWLIENSSFQGI